MRVYKLIEYEGDDKWIESTLEESLSVMKCDKGTIVSSRIHIDYKTQLSDLVIEIIKTKIRAGLPVEGY